MRAIRLLWLTLAVALLLPGLARAAPQRISTDEYRARLERAAVHLRAGRVDQARAEMGSTWEVTLPKGGSVTVDLRPVQGLQSREAATVLDEHLRALDAALAASRQDITPARRELDKALATAAEQQRAKDTMVDWFSRLWNRLFGGRQPSPETAPPQSDRPSWLTYVALAIGAIGIGVLGWNLWQSLAANAAGTDVAVRTGRKAGRPDRPLTPDELWQLASEEAAAGDYKEGLRLAHLALLQHLDRTGLLRYVPAQTNREHEWSLRRKFPELARTMHQLNDLVESRLYSGHGATAEDFGRGETLARQLWREGDAQSTRNAQETTGASSSASSS